VGAALPSGRAGDEGHLAGDASGHVSGP